MSPYDTQLCKDFSEDNQQNKSEKDYNNFPKLKMVI